MFHTQRIRHVLALPHHRVVEVGIIIALALGVGGTLAITGGLFTPARQEAAPRALTGPVGNNPAGSSIEAGRQSWAAVHPAGGAAPVEQPVTAALTAREARAQELQQQALTMLNEGNYVRAQELTKQRQAALQGDQSASVASPALTEQQARARALRKQGGAYLHTGDWQHAQQYYKQSDALLRAAAQ